MGRGPGRSNTVTNTKFVADFGPVGVVSVGAVRYNGDMKKTFEEWSSEIIETMKLIEKYDVPIEEYRALYQRHKGDQGLIQGEIINNSDPGYYQLPLFYL